MEPPPVQYATTSDGVSIAFAVKGSGPPMVFVRTWSSTHVRLNWERDFSGRLYGALAAKRTLITFDRRGVGLSDRDIPELTLETLTLDLEAVVDQLELERFALFGWVFGMMVSTMYALRHPERVSAIISLGGLMAGHEYYQSPRGKALRAMREADYETWLQTMAAINADPQLNDIVGASVTPEGHKAFVSASEAFDATDQVAQLDLPVLLLYRDGDPGWPHQPPSAREMAKRIRGARLVGLHWKPPETYVERLVSAVDAFLGDVAPGEANAAPKTVAQRDQPSLLRTVLFTDIVGHTEMMQRLGDAHGRDVLREHERITRETLKQHGGTEIKTMGDGFLASFGSVTAAMECAIALQRAFATHTASMPEPLHVRVGLNAGEPIEEDGDLFGSTVILASRIAAKAGAGEILVPDTVRGLLSGKSFLFSDRGEFVPKGFDDAVRLYEVRWREDN